MKSMDMDQRAGSRSRRGVASLELVLLFPLIGVMGVSLFFCCHIGVRRLQEESAIRQKAWEKRPATSLNNSTPYQVSPRNLLVDQAEAHASHSTRDIVSKHYQGLARLGVLTNTPPEFKSQTASVAGTWDAVRIKEIQGGWEKPVGQGIFNPGVHTNLAGLLLRAQGQGALANTAKPPGSFHRDSALASLGETPGNFSQDNLLTSLKKHLDTFKQKITQLLESIGFKELEKLVDKFYRSPNQLKNIRADIESTIQRLESRKQQLLLEIKKIKDKLIKNPNDKTARQKILAKEKEIKDIDTERNKMRGSGYDRMNDLIRVISGG